MISARQLLAGGVAPLVLALVVHGAPAAGAGTPEVRYEDRLRMPSRSDPIGRPGSVHADVHTGEVFVADTPNSRLLVFDRARLLDFVIPGGTTFRAPVEVAVDSDGFLYVLGSRRGRTGIVRLDFDGRFLRDIELTGVPEGVEVRPSSIAVSHDGTRLAVVDETNARLWIAVTDGRVVADVDLAEGLDEKDAEEQIIGRVDVYGDTIVLAFPTQGKIRLYDLEGNPRGSVGIKGVNDCQMAFPMAAALDRDGNVLVIDNQRAIITRWQPEGNRCLSEHSGIGQSEGAIYRPSDIALDAEGSFYVSQGFEARIQRFVGSSPAAGAPEAPGRGREADTSQETAAGP